MKHKKIWIFGVIGSGKSTLARNLSLKYKIPFKSLDDFVYKKKWIIRNSEKEKKLRLKEFAKKDKWIIEGVQAKEWIAPYFKKADIVIVLKIPITQIIIRIIKRYLKNLFKKKKSRSLKDNIVLIKNAIIYKNEWNFRYENLIKKYKSDFVIIKNKKDIKNLMERLK